MLKAHRFEKLNKLFCK